MNQVAGHSRAGLRLAGLTESRDVRMVNVQAPSHLEGHLDLVCAVDEAGRSYVKDQSFSAPFHLSKPYCDGPVLVVQVVNPTAGLFKGDHLRSAIRVEPGARLHLTSPGACRVHTMQKGGARAVQRFYVGSRAWLEYFPSPLIPQRGCSYSQSTRVEASADAQFFLAETLAPGRVAHGECFQFTELSWELDLLIEGRLLARERFRLRPGEPSLRPLQAMYPNPYYVSAWLYSRRATAHSIAWERIHALASDAVTLGASQVSDGLWAIKLIAADSVAVSKSLRSIRSILSADLTELQCLPRRY